MEYAVVNMITNSGLSEREGKINGQNYQRRSTPQWKNKIPYEPKNCEAYISNYPILRVKEHSRSVHLEVQIRYCRLEQW